MSSSFDSLYETVANGDLIKQKAALHEVRNILHKNQSLYMQKKDFFLKLIGILSTRKIYNWQVINIIINTITEYNPRPEEKEKYLAFIIEASYSFTHSFFKHWNQNPTPPDLRKINQFIEKHALISKETVFVFAKHCTLGFIQKPPFLNSFIPLINNVVDYVLHCDPSEYDMLLEPLSSPDKQVQVFFLIVWVKAMNTLHKSFFARQALVIRAHSLFELNKDPCTSSGSTYLIEITKSTPNQLGELFKFSEKLSNGLLDVLQQLSQGEHTQTHQEAKDVVMSKQKVSVIQRAKAHIFISKVFYSTWEPISIALIAEARVMMWGKTETQMKCGKAIGFSAIQNATITDAQKKGLMNVIVVKSNDKEEYKFAFESPNIASQWVNVLQSQKQK
jgi:hypothetical protein